QPRGTMLYFPSSGSDSDLSVLARPVDIVCQSGGERSCAGFERLLVKVEQLKRLQSRRQISFGHRSIADWGQALPKRDGEFDLLQTIRTRHGVRAEDHCDNIGAGDQKLDLGPPVLEVMNIAPVDQEFEAPAGECRVQPIHEEGIDPRVGNENMRERCRSSNDFCAPWARNTAPSGSRKA